MTEVAGGLKAAPSALNKAGRAALRAIAPALFVLGTGLLAAKNLDDLRLQAAVFIIAALTAAAGALQEFVPFLSWRKYIAERYAKYADAFSQAFAGSFLSLLIGWLGAPDFNFSTAGISALLVGAGTAGVRALQAMITPGERIV